MTWSQQGGYSARVADFSDRQRRGIIIALWLLLSFLILLFTAWAFFLLWERTALDAHPRMDFQLILLFAGLVVLGTCVWAGWSSFLLQRTYLNESQKLLAPIHRILGFLTQILFLIAVPILAVFYILTVRLRFELLAESGTTATQLGVYVDHLLTMIGGVVTVGGFLVAGFALLFVKRIEKLHEVEQLVEHVADLANVAAESVLAGLPRPSESQQVSQASLGVLGMMNEVLLSNRSASSQRDPLSGPHLEMALALFEYGRGNFEAASTGLSELPAVAARSGDLDLWAEVVWFKAVVDRQKKDIVSAGEGFSLLLREGENRGDDLLKSQGLVGLALCNLSTQLPRDYDEFLETPNPVLTPHRIESMSPKPIPNRKHTLSRMAHLRPSKREDPMLWMYFLRLLDFVDPVEAELLEEGEIVMDLLADWLKAAAIRARDLNLQASYEVNFAYVCLRRFLITTRGTNDCLSDALGYLAKAKEHARQFGDLMTRRGHTPVIYSEFQEALVGVAAFCKEIDEMKVLVENLQKMAEHLTRFEERLTGLCRTADGLQGKLDSISVSISSIDDKSAQASGPSIPRRRRRAATNAPESTSATTGPTS